MGSLVLRKGSVDGCSLLRRFSAGISRSRTHCASTGGGRRMMSMVANSADESNSASSPFTLPWLMLQPAFEGGDKMVFDFYSIAEKKVVRSEGEGEKKVVRSEGEGEKKVVRSEGEGEWAEELPLPDVKFVGSSHGWLALFNQRNCDLFLLNPLSGRRIKLPPIHTLTVPTIPDGGSARSVTKVIISCCPDEDEEECRAVMSFGPTNRLAFCWPGRSTEWIHIGESFNVERKLSREYEDFVYSRTQNLFFCTIRFHDNYLEGWDLGDPVSPKMVKYELDFDEENYPWPAGSKLKDACRQLKYLVFVEQSKELFLVTRHVNPRTAPDGSYVKPIWYGEYRGWDYSYPYKTFDFDVHKIIDDRKLEYMEGNGSLDGLAMFVGCNHSFAMPEFPQLMPNSIYFTDENKLMLPDSVAPDYGGHDSGIFDYQNKSFSSCYYPWDYQCIKRIVPPPIWFTPGPH